MRDLISIALVLVIFPLCCRCEVIYQTSVGVSHSVGTTSITSSERITYRCAYRNLWTKERQPVNYPDEYAMWRGPIMWTHSSEFESWERGKPTPPGMAKFVKGRPGVDFVQELQGDPDNFWTYTENPYLILELGTRFQQHRSSVNMYPIEARAEYPYLSAVASMKPSPDWFTGFYNVSLTQGGFWYDHVKFQTYVWDAGIDDRATYTGGREDDSEDNTNGGGVPGPGFKPFAPPAPQNEEETPIEGEENPNNQVGGIPGFQPFGAPQMVEENNSPSTATTKSEESPPGTTIERIEFPNNTPVGGELLAAGNMPNVPVVAEFECYLNVGPKDMDLPDCDWFANPCCNETDAQNCGAELPFGVMPSITKEYQEVIDAELGNILTNSGQVEEEETIINFGTEECSDCDQPGYFCGIDGECHEFSCQNYYQFAHLDLTGYDGGKTELECSGYIEGPQEHAHGVVYGCDTVFPFEMETSGQHATKPFNQKCIAEREGGYLFECYEFLPSQSATNFDFFEKESNSLFPACEDGSPPKYFINIASSNHYLGFDGLQGDAIVAGGADSNGDTLWASKEGHSFFDQELALRSMYANVVIPKDSPNNENETNTDFDEEITNSVWAVINNNPDLSSFAEALQLAGLDTVLKANNKQYTVFAPANEAIDEDPAFSMYMSLDQWVHHLSTNLQLMIVPNQALRDEDIFDKKTTELQSLNGTLAVDRRFATINLRAIKETNIEGSNGIVHIMNGVIKNAWREYTLRDVDQQEDLQMGLSPLLDRIGFDEPLNERLASGLSLVASEDRGFGNDSIALGSYPVVQELKDPDNADFLSLAMEYSILDFNIYEQDFPRGSQMMAMGRSGLAHMWVTKDHDQGVLRFNDAILQRQAFADNGITQIVNKPLIPPGIAMHMKFCADYTTINLMDMANFYSSSGWNVRNLTRSIGTALGSLSVFAPLSPLQDGQGDFTVEMQARLRTLVWQRHLWDLLLHLTLEPAYTTEELYEMTEHAGGYLQMKMLSGFNTTLEIDKDGEMTLDGARFLKPYDMKGIDGFAHLVEQVPLPPSILQTIYFQTQQAQDMSTVRSLIDTVQLGVFIDKLSPLTFFSAVNSAWDINIPALEIEDVLKNMIFELLWFDDYLAQMDGETLTSVNGKKWAVQVVFDPIGEPLHYAPELKPVKIYISNTEGPKGLTNCTVVPGRHQTNILAKTGIIHRVDCLFLHQNYTKQEQEATTLTPISSSFVSPTPGMPTSVPTNGPSAVPSTAPSVTIDETEDVSANVTKVLTTAPRVLVVNTSFDVFNTEGLTAQDLLLPENRAVLLEAFSDFVASMLVSLESNQQKRQLKTVSATSHAKERRLSVTLQPDSADVYDVIDVQCQEDAPVPIPGGATCQTVLGRYDLEISEEEKKEAVHSAYLQATNDAIKDGKLQTSLEEAAQNSALASIVIAGPSPESTRASTTIEVVDASSGQEGSCWRGQWLTLALCLSCLMAG